MLPQTESCVYSRLYDVHMFPVALLHPWISVHLVHSWEGGGCLSKRCRAFHHGNGTRECGRGGVVCCCFTKDLIKWLKGKGGKMQLLTQKMLSWAYHLLKAGRLGSTAGSMKPFWIMCSCFVVAPLQECCSQTLMEAAFRCCQDEVFHPQWETRNDTWRPGGKKEVLVILILELKGPFISKHWISNKSY